MTIQYYGDIVKELKRNDVTMDAPVAGSPEANNRIIKIYDKNGGTEVARITIVGEMKEVGDPAVSTLCAADIKIVYDPPTT